MSEDRSPVYLVSDESDPAVLKIDGRASYLNCSPVDTFLRQMPERGRTQVIVDFARCTGMDSTFLGLLASTAMDYRRLQPSCKLTLTNLNGHNRKLVCDLGLTRILEIADAPENNHSRLADAGQGTASRDTIREAHESLAKVDDRNEAKFRDVLNYLRKDSYEQG